MFLSMTSVLLSQAQDSLVYDLFNLRGKNDRSPELYRCNNTELSFSNDNLKYCLSRSLENLNNDIKYPIRKISTISEYEIEICSVYDPNKKYTSLLKLTLDKSGQVSNIETLSHCVESLSENNLKNILSNTIWRPALKNLEPVVSKLIIEITYENSFCHGEIWAKTKRKLYRRFPNYRKELMFTYIEKGVMWDLEILYPMMEYQNKNSLEKVFNKVEKSCNAFIDSLSTAFIELNNGELENNCQETYELVNKWEKQFYQEMDNTLKKELTDNPR